MAKKISGKLKAPKTGANDNALTASVDAFLEDVRHHPDSVVAAQEAKLIFALDATMSRQPTWDIAQQVQGEMFAAAQEVGGLSVQVVFFRGQGELRKSNWTTSPAQLADKMSRVRCQGGLTQIGRVLRDALKTLETTDVKAIVYIGDAVEENPDVLSDHAAKLGMQGAKLFVFQEGQDVQVKAVFQEMARLGGGAYAQFNQDSAAQLKALLRAVGAYSANGMAGLSQLALKDAQAARLLKQLPGSTL